MIEALQPAIVVPGHGAPFTRVAESIAVARKRLHGFVTDPIKHVQYAAKVLLKFRLLQVQQIERQAMLEWALATPYFVSMFQRHFAEQDFAAGIDRLLQDLVRSGSAALEGGVLHNL